MKQPKYIISGGGTGGHIFPAVAIADALKQENPETSILFIGAKGKMEMEKIPQLGYNIKGLWISGIQRKIDLSNLLFPLKLIVSLIKAVFIIIKFKPNAVIGTGGFASAPTLKAAQWLGYPTLIQEQNSYAGVTNKWLSAKAKSICVAYPNMERYFPKQKLKFTGNPIRNSLLANQLNSSEAKEKLHLEQKLTLFVVGGSLGSQRINQLINSNLEWLISEDLQLIWQTGKIYYQTYQSKQSKSVKVKQFIEDMNLAYSAADIIISRAGAGTVSELATVGKPVLFIPSPNVAENHQFKNAQSICDQNAGVMIEEQNLEAEFQDLMSQLITDQNLKVKLANNLKNLAKPEATQHIVDEVKRIQKPL
ncbi:UDP-N-acetylglucosamine-N-acetylmuramylpentapeptide N-acetylglucosamine transferase [Psychroflexus salarius]|uniref:UDP-N-acetylglucosamine--N-acetylmuramyl-(pentapeptide) pyrophosphoryl-undecaprenol N-acetylglucosamine transferase n=1 Tax=Psychroflexus salarius TaxID=1155689 RepID=A0A1M4X9R0_9FLAO|nr:undecaprenyldiphospho-muramoylpentapeptide beta-N-acetylglucosaminyltransferase [Psychroflexus salarius]SHE90156.1 UDP-N-acetylglucosamine-N-acetylmuramylpentapeptide N-acetylglucosamine transferase [Psychroflexus salarius]